MVNALLDWIQQAPLQAVISASLATFLVTLLAGLVTQRHHARRCFAEGQASRQHELDRLQAGLDNVNETLHQLQTERQQLHQQHSSLMAELGRHKAETERIPELENRWRELQQQLNRVTSENAGLHARLQEQQKLNAEQKALMDKAQESLTAQFQNLAQKILDEKSRTFTEQNQHNIKATLSPLQQQLSHFQELIRKTHQEGAEKHSVLLKEIDNLKKLNLNISEEARNLTRALTADSKAQGNWGELVLERVLESSGLQKGREYDTQFHLTEDGRRYHPDVVIHLPENKDIIIDAKVTLTHYERFRNADTQAAREMHLKQHIDSLRTHARQLSEKNYQGLKGVHTVNFVIMFVPVEPAYLEAMNREPRLLEEFINKGVLILSTSNLLATLRTIATLWQNERRNQNALEIARRAGALYDKFVGFCDDLQLIKTRLDQADTAWHSAENKLASGRGNLIRSVQGLRKLGAQTKKQLTEQWLQKSEDEIPVPVDETGHTAVITPHAPDTGNDQDP